MKYLFFLWQKCGCCGKLMVSIVGTNRLWPPNIRQILGNALQGSSATFQPNCPSQLKVREVWYYLHWLSPEWGPISFSIKNVEWSSCCVNTTCHCLCGDAGSIPGLAQWVKDLVLRYRVQMWLGSSFRGGGVCLSCSYNSTPNPGKFHMPQVWP